MDTGISPADLAAVVKDNDNFGGAWWIIILFVCLFGGNGLWNNGGDFGRYATAASQQEILFGQQFQGLDNKLDRLGNGICDATYALNNAITGEGRTLGAAVANGFSDMQKCCCETQREIDAVKYDGAINTAAINANIDAKFAALEKGQLEQQIAAQAAQIQQLQLNAAMCGVVRYPNSTTYTAGFNPYLAAGTTF